MRLLILSMFLLNSISSFAKPAHDIPMAIFNLTIEENSVSLDILFDKVDLEQALVPQKSPDALQQQIEDYLSENMQWIFNQKVVVFEICSMEKNREHYQIKADFVDIKRTPTQVELSNTCLIKTIDSHSNIVHVFYQEKQRSFRLHKARTKTSFEL